MSGRGLRAHIRTAASLVLAALAAVAYGSAAAADTLEWALVQAYQNNPSLNAQRAALRATDENVPQALSGYRPKVSITANGGFNYSSTLSESVNQAVFPNSVSYSNLGRDFGSRGAGVTATQTLFNGFQTANKTRQAESQVMGARETLRVTEQQVLLDGATAYMNLLRDEAILDLNRSNVEVLTEQLKQTRDRFNVGEVTRTDVAQAESRLAAGRSALLGAQSNYVTSQANYRRVIGVDPGRLAPGTPVDRFSPPSLPGAVTAGESQSPSVLAASYGVDVAELAVKISEGALYPNLSLTASAAKNYDPLYNVRKQTTAAVLGSLTIPLYQGGAEYSAIRQSKETVGQQRLNLDVTRDEARATVVQSWGQLDAAKAQIEATTAQVNAAEIALNGVREEARVGQRTTLDVLNAQQELVNARVALVTAQHDRVVASYTLLAAVGGLSMQHLGLNVLIYDPQVHYQQVRDAWIGVRTPDGK
ncbi:MAG TPA: TolC family outer membrane protein [Xanthobacteraceae bacterium]|jgi:outer membrane protein|nr:TolC family outer membrane protein [Xanthobacteraceae bacterium]